MATITGTTDAETLDGSVDADTILGLAGDDTIFGSALGDSIDGGDDIDTVDYHLSGDAVTVSLASGTGAGGDAEDDTYTSIENVVGSDLDDDLTGNDLANVLEGGLGADTIDGGIGTDTASYSQSGSGVSVNLTSGINTGGDAEDDVLSNIENLTGSDFDDTLVGNTSANVLDGGAANDVLNGGAGLDTLLGGEGDDTLIGGAAADSLSGGNGSDTADYSAAGSAVTLSLLTGTGSKGDALGDVLSLIENVNGSASNDSITGGTGSNELFGLGGKDSLLGGNGDDILDGGAGNDSMTGGAGNDTFYVDSTTDKASESAAGGTDLVYASANFELGLNVENLTLTGTGNLNGTGNSLANTIIGNTGDNSLAGGSGNDEVSGGDGNDTLDGQGGNDAMDGGDGDDIYIIDSTLDTVSELADEGTDTVNTIFAWTLATDFENLTLTGSSSVAGTGNAKDNVIQGNGGSNSLSGLDGNDSIVADILADTLAGGNDTLNGGDGDNTLVGGLGNDTYIVTTGTDTIVEGATAGTDEVRSDVDFVLAANVENLVLNGGADLDGTGNGLANVITGNTGANELSGANGADTLFGGNGNDTLTGGAGTDSLVGGIGNDDYYVDATSDKTLENATQGNDRVFSSANYTLSSNFEELYATGTGDIDLTGNTDDNIIEGNSGANKLLGSSGADTLTGNDGNDTLDGGVGVDSMAGGDGDDIYKVDEAFDLTDEDADMGHDTVQTALNWTLGENIEDLVLQGASVATGTGNASDNTLTGNSAANNLKGLVGADTLIGGGGADTLDGGIGDDSMVGGIGNDTYTLSSADDVIVEDVGEGTDLVKTGLTFVLGDNFENLTLTGTDDVNGTGNDLRNLITGNSGNNELNGLDGIDTLVGNAGDDTIDGGAGADSMAGGAGADTYYVDDTGDIVVETSPVQIDTVVSSVTYTLSAYVENLDLVSGTIDGTGNSVANSITGTSLSNVLTGLGGQDSLIGLGGADTLAGGAGNDTMDGGNGGDVFMVNSALDVVIDGGATGTDRVESLVHYTLGSTIENLTLAGTTRINGTGNALDNVILGNNNNNKITGLAGDDTLTGGDGADSFIFTTTSSGIDTITDYNDLVSGLAEGDKLQFAASLLVGTFDYVGAGAFSGGSDNSEARVNTVTGRVIVDTDGDGAGDIVIALDGLVDAAQLTIADFVFV